MKLQNLTVIFIIIILPIVLVLSAYIGYEIKTINKQNMYNTGLTSATSDAIFAFELNTKNDVYYNNAESKRSNIKAAIKTFENSLSNTCNLGLYNNEAIEEYIPAIVFGLYDGFYMYAPTQTQSQGYKHDLKNYVYYSEEIKQGNIDIVIRYTLDNYVAVSGKIGDKYVTKAGYLINLNDLNGSVIKDKLEETRIKYKGLIIETESIEEYGKGEKTGKIIKVVDDKSNNLAIAYYKEAYEFTNWFMNEVKIGQTVKYLNIGNTNDPEDENSPFVQHKREIMKNKIQSILNSSITAYSNKTRNNYKMPILRAEDWDKIYNNISVISFVQGINLGFKNYNHYCVINSTNNQEYVNPNLIYFTDGNSYHDIRCTDENVDWKNATGYKIGSFEKQTYEAEKKNEDGATITDAQGNPVLENRYYYKHNELACYKCINGSERSSKSIFDFMKNDANTVQKIAYYSALARERKSTVKLLNAYNAETLRQYTITYEAGDTNGKEVTGMPEPQTITEGENYTVSDTTPTAEGWNFKDWKVEGSNPSTTYDAGGTIYQPSGDITLVAQWERKTITVTFDTNGGTSVNPQTIPDGEKVTRPACRKTGYTLSGWYTDKGILFDFDTKITNSITLHARWNPNIYKITLKKNETENYEIIEARYNETITLPNLTSTEQKTFFNGWSESKNASEGDITTITVTGNKTYYATWITDVVAKFKNTYYKTLQAAINQISTSDKTIYLLADVNENITILADKDRTIELNNYKINGKLDIKSHDLIIRNGTINGYIIYNDTPLSVGLRLNNIMINNTTENYGINIERGSVQINNSIVSSTANTIYNKGNLIINDSDISNNNNNVAIYNYNGNVTINSGTITTGASNTINNKSSGTVTINGGIIENNSAVDSNGRSYPTVRTARTNAIDTTTLNITEGTIRNNGGGITVCDYSEYYIWIFGKQYQYNEINCSGGNYGEIVKSHPQE